MIGSGEEPVEEIDVVEAVRAAIAVIDPPDGFDIRVEGACASLHGVRVEFDLILRNLISNAIKHHDRDTGQITVRCSPFDDGEIRLEVEDDGPGIPEEHLSDVFVKFVKLERRGEVEGTGLGLAAVARAVQSAGGQIFATNRLDGRGARFVIGIPVNRAAA